MGAGTDAWWDFGPSETGGPLMPPAIPETPGQLTNWGLTENAPGVWSQDQYASPPTEIVQKFGSQAASLWQKFLSGDKSAFDLLMGAAPGLLQEFFASQRGNQLSGDLRGIAEQARADRWPFLDYSLNLLKGGPEAYAAGPGAGAVKGILSGLSARAGNPYDNPGSIMRGSAELGGLWQNAVTGFGNIGLAGQDTRSGFLARAAEAGAPTTGAGFGDAMASVFGEKKTLANLLKQLKDSGMIDTEWSFA